MQNQHAIEPWKTVDTSTILDRQPFLTVANHVVQLPNGRVIPDWTMVNTPDYVNVVCLTQTQPRKVVVFRQTKYAIGLAYPDDPSTLALVGGYVEQGEAPLYARFLLYIATNLSCWTTKP